MLTLTVRTESRGLTLAIALVTLATPSFFTGAAWADKVALSGTYSQSQMLGICNKAGGAFSSSDSGFSCLTGKGSVECSTNGKCSGECATCGGPAIRPKGGLSGVLSGIAQRGGAAAQPVHGTGSSHNPIVATPVENHPVILEHSGEEHPGKH
jgi:hypothetical protein